MSQFLLTETVIIILLAIVTLVAIFVRRLRIPYTVALVIIGLIIASQPILKFEITSQLILALFVPPLVFEAAFHLNMGEIRRNLTGILLLAVPGVILNTLIIGSILSLGAGLAFPVVLLFGTIIAATDPVSVVALFRTLGVPKRLAVLVEGESLFNDGTAIVIFNLMLAFALTGNFNLAKSISDFLYVAIGGVLIGLATGWIISQLIARIDDYLIETTLTTILAFGSYLIAEQFHFSGVLAVVAAGLINGNMGQRGMSPTTRVVLFNFWEYVAFLANSLVFLLIGMQINLSTLLASWQPIAWAILAALVGRAIVVYGLSWLANRFSKPLPMSWQHVLNWSGLRGAISLALALSLPASLRDSREEIRLMVFGVVLFTLLVQSTTMNQLIRWLNIITRGPAQIEYDTRHARLTSLRFADAHLDRLHHDGLLSTHAWEKLKESVSRQAASMTEAVRELLLSEPAIEADELNHGWRELSRAQKSALLGLRQEGVITDDVYETLAAEVDLQMSEGYQPDEGDGAIATQFLEVSIPADAGVAGKDISAIVIPRSAVFVSIRRSKEIIIPRGDTQILPGDVVTLLCDRAIVPAVRDLLLSPRDLTGEDHTAA